MIIGDIMNYKTDPACLYTVSCSYTKPLNCQFVKCKNRLKGQVLSTLSRTCSYFYNFLGVCKYELDKNQVFFTDLQGTSIIDLRDIVKESHSR